MYHRLFTSILGLMAVLALSLTSLSAERLPPPTYAIGTIPDQRIWYNIAGQELAFSISAEALGPSPTVTMTLDQANSPLGSVSFDSPSRLFRYRPDRLDDKPFTVTFLAVGSGTPIVQQVVITPLPPVAPESDAFGTGPNGPLPDDQSRDYLAVQDVLSSDSIPFNSSDSTGIQTRSITIIGKTVVLDEGHPNGLFERINGQENIRDLVISAETLIIRKSLDLPQTNITIHAHVMRLEDPQGGPPVSISTTPRVPFGDTAPPPVGSAGFLTKSQRGHDAGDLRLFVRELTAPGSTKRFLLGGGRGRRASAGKDGTDAGFIEAVPRQWRTSRGTYDLGTDYCIAAWAAIDAGIPDQFTPSEDTYNSRKQWTSLNGHAEGSNDYPGNAQAGGKPGDPGRGGDVESSIDIAALVDNRGGAAGTVAPTAQGGSGVRVRKAGSRSPPAASEVSSSARVIKVTVDCQGNIFDPCSSYDADVTYSTVRGQDGTDAAGPQPDRAVGDAGSYSTVPSDDARWLSPQAMQVVLSYLNDAYLDGHVDAVAASVQDYLDAITIVMARPSWSALLPSQRADLEGIRDELEILRHRLGSNLDYFGNPAGWVPMLSFEVNKAAFDNEIDVSLQVMYLNYWLGNRARNQAEKLAAMRAIRTRLLQQIDQDRAAYNAAVESVPLVQVDAENVQLQIDTMIYRIREIEDRLLPKAKSLVILRRTARTLGVIAQSIPVYQPALGAAGGAVAASAEIDPNASWEQNSILVGTGAAAGFANGQALAKAGAAQQGINSIDTRNPEANSAAAESLRQARAPLLQLMVDSYSAASATKTSDPEVAAELQRLLADVPEYRVLQSDLLKLNATKHDFFARLADLIQQMTTTSVAISRNLRSIALLNTSISQGVANLDPSLVAYLHDMDRRARARLLKYHYYVTRAYAYRRLEPYPGTLNLQKVFDHLANLANASSTEEMTASEFASLKAVYQDQLSTVALGILGDLNDGPPERSQVLELELPADVIKQINETNAGRYNLRDSGLFSISEENLRITRITVKSMAVASTQGTPAPVYADLVIRHSGLSELQKDGKSFLFRHYNERTRSAISWKARRWFSDGRIDHSEPAKASASLIESLVPGTQDLLLYTRPAAFADLLFSLESNSFDARLELSSVSLRIEYDYTDRADQIRTLRIVGGPNGIEPDIAITVADRNGRGSGRGPLERFYPRDAQVSITAPAMMGSFAFDHWSGSGISDPSARSQSLVMNRHYTLAPVYRSTVNHEVQVTGALGGGTYAVGDTVQLVAVPPAGERFLRWEGASVEDPLSPVTEAFVFEPLFIRAVFTGSEKYSALTNVSNRAWVGTGDNVLIPGFVVSGSGGKRVLVRAVGPGLSALGVEGYLADPEIVLWRSTPGGSSPFATSKDWGGEANAAEIASVSESLGAFPLQAGSSDAALLLDLAPGVYSVITSGTGGSTGVALVEVYDAEPGVRSDRLVNISGRALVGLNERVFISGFVVRGDAKKRFLIRAVGPGLAQFDLSGLLDDPQLVLYRNNSGTPVQIGTNDNWGDAANAAEIISVSPTIGAFPLTEGSRDAAILMELEPGIYTAVASGVADATGIALLEVYEVTP